MYTELVSDRTFKLNLEPKEYVKVQDKTGAVLRVSQSDEATFDGVGEGAILAGYINIVGLEHVGQVYPLST